MKVAIAQAKPATLDLKAGIKRTISWIQRAADEKVSLLAFGEAFIGGYPVWCDWPGWSDFNSDENAAVYARMLDSSIRLESEELNQLCKVCGNCTMDVVIGVNLLSGSGKSIYNALLTIDSSGQLRSVRRKLMPTHGERLCWAQAENKEAAAVASVEMPGGDRVGGLMCWEHWMPRARDTMHKTGEDIHIAAWPHCSELHQLASRHYAFEGSCYVLTTALVMSRDDLPELSIEIPESFTGLHGGSAIIAPDTSYVVEPVLDKEELIIVEIDVEDSKRASFRLDTGGHYDRPDVI